MPRPGGWPKHAHTRVSSSCLFCPLCWPLPLSPPHSCQLRRLLFAVYIWWRSNMPPHCFVLALTILLKEKREEDVRKVLNMSELLTKCHSTLDLHEALFCFSSNMPQLWLMPGLQPSLSEVWSAVLWIGAICWHVSGRLAALIVCWRRQSQYDENPEHTMRMAGMQCVIFPIMKDQYLCEHRKAAISLIGRHSRGISTWLRDS